MSALLNAMLSQSASGQFLTMREVSKFTAAEIRQTMADLVGNDRVDLADALSAAGLSLYPDSEDILAMSALLAEIKSDWDTAEQLLTQLMTQQGQHTTPFTWRHLIRVLRCQCEPGKALLMAKQAMTAYPEDDILRDEFLSLQELVSEQMPVEAPTQLH
ncbi:hypothetical protein [Limnohabitans sp. 15K]|uniref:hypothetical protein n=1 Tax=Limnohabitans sp. 15K TaxID=1100706 RepID=UPI000C1EEE25|nr:hypothetical protein [Limnohabitans sp. 15K]PIT82081.1 hypothetical protein B9Z40_10920 [Limnohabitans sp. 15K]